MVGRGEGLATEGGGGGRVDVSVCVRYLSFVSLSCPTNISAFQVFLCPKANGHPWLIFGTTFKIYDIFGKVTQKSMGK